MKEKNPSQLPHLWHSFKYRLGVNLTPGVRLKVNYTSLLHQAKVSLVKTLSSRKRDKKIDKCLPPTEISLVPNVQRSAYPTFIPRQCCHSSPVIPSPTAFGWVDDDATKLFVVDTQIFYPGNDDNPDSDEHFSSDNDSSSTEIDNLSDFTDSE